MKNLYTGMKKEKRKHWKDPMDGAPTRLVAFWSPGLPVSL